MAAAQTSSKQVLTAPCCMHVVPLGLSRKRGANGHAPGIQALKSINLVPRKAYVNSLAYEGFTLCRSTPSLTTEVQQCVVPELRKASLSTVAFGATTLCIPSLYADLEGWSHRRPDAPER
jgi:hypothetical protein